MKTVATRTEIVHQTTNFEIIVNRFTQFVDVSQATTRSYMYGIKSFIRYISDNGIKTPTRETVLMYKKELTRTKSAGTIALYLSSLRRFFAWCESEGLYQNITNGVKSPKVDTGHKKDAFSAQQLKSIIAGIERNGVKGKRNYAIFCLISATGLRTIEVVRADIADIRTIGGEVCLFIQGKGRTSKSDFVKLSEPVMRAIQDYLATRGHMEDNEPLFASVSRRNMGGRMTTRSISRICKSAMINSGFNSKRLTAHSLRHTAVTLALISGLSLQEVSQFARHSNISVTMIYAHDIERLKSKCECVISNAIFGA